MRKQCCKINCNPSGRCVRVQRVTGREREREWAKTKGKSRATLPHTQQGANIPGAPDKRRPQSYWETISPLCGYVYVGRVCVSLCVMRMCLGVWKPDGIIHFSPKATLSVFRVYTYTSTSRCVLRWVRIAHTRPRNVHTQNTRTQYGGDMLMVTGRNVYASYV